MRIPQTLVNIYLPGGKIVRALSKRKSCANDVGPVLLLRSQRKEALASDPPYRVIIHNGEPAGSWAGHFDAVVLQ